MEEVAQLCAEVARREAFKRQLLEITDEELQDWIRAKLEAYSAGASASAPAATSAPA